MAAVVVAVIFYLNPGIQGGIGVPAGAPTAPVSTTKFDVPAGTRVPETGEKVDSKDVAVPVSVTQSAPGADTKIRTFNIKALADAFDPSTVIANVGDTIHINFTAADKTYDISVPDYGLKQTAQKGETKILEFQAVTEGKYLYYCDLCGGQKSSTKGYIIVTAKK